MYSPCLWIDKSSPHNHTTYLPTSSSDKTSRSDEEASMFRKYWEPMPVWGRTAMIREHGGGWSGTYLLIQIFKKEQPPQSGMTGHNKGWKVRQGARNKNGIWKRHTTAQKSPWQRDGGGKCDQRKEHAVFEKRGETIRGWTKRMKDEDSLQSSQKSWLNHEIKLQNGAGSTLAAESL